MKTLRDFKRKPTHPGAIIREDILPELKLTQGKLHRLSNFTDETLEIIEVQSGSYVGEDDIERVSDTYGRVT